MLMLKSNVLCDSIIKMKGDEKKMNEKEITNKAHTLIYIRGEYKEAIKICNKVLNINPENADVWYNKGLALVSLEEFDEGIECYDKALEIDPENAVAWYKKGNLLDSLGKHKEAKECLNKAKALG